MLLDNVKSSRVSHEYSNLIKTPAWFSPETYNLSNATCEIYLSSSALWAITLDVRLECDGSNTCHWIYTRYYTGKSLNLLKIFIRVIESYLHRRQWEYKVKNLHTNHNWFIDNKIIILYN